MSIDTSQANRRRYARTIAAPTYLLAVAAVAALGLFASCVALMGGVELVP